jgi:oligopeptide transport system ATP-binding protein
MGIDYQELPLLAVAGLKKHFPIKGRLGSPTQFLKAVDDVSFSVFKGETYGLVGESGCGKSTTARTILRLTDPSAGEAIFDGSDLFKLTNAELKAARKDLQIVFQDPYSSLNPRLTVGGVLREALEIHKVGTRQQRQAKVREILELVGLREDHEQRLPHELSGGQRQRVGIARALILSPRLVVCDESVSALDVSVQAQIINLLKSIQRSTAISYLFVSHDMSVIRHISDRVGVMYLGRLVEEASSEALFRDPKHPYTKALLSSVPVPNPRVRRVSASLQGETPSALNLPSGCVFRTRCPLATATCAEVVPQMSQLGRHHRVACHLAT